MLTTWRVARSLALSLDPRQRWRQVSVIVAAFVATFAALLGTGVVNAASGSDARIMSRSPVWSQDETPELSISLRGLTLEGFGQFPVVWLQPRPGQPSNDALVPPGLDAIPAPGEAVLSPGLVASGFSAEDVGLADSDAGSGPDGAIGDAGLSSRSEGFIYARPEAGRSLGTGGALLPMAGYHGDSERASLETIPDVPGRTAALVGAAWTLWLPGMYLLIGASRAVSVVRDRRAITLWRLGISTGSIRRVVAVETMILAGLGALPAVLCWQLSISGSTSLPFTGAELLPNELRTAWPVAVGMTALVVCLAGLAAAAGRVTGRNLTKDSRRVRAYHAIPLGLALAAMAVSPWIPGPGNRGLTVLFVGLLATFVALPPGLPVLVGYLAGTLQHVRHPAVWLAGKRLSLRTHNLSRPAAMVGALVFMAGAALALHAGLRAGEPDTYGNADRSVWTVDWRQPLDGDIEALSTISPEMSIVPVLSNADDPSASFASCTDVVSFLGLSADCPSETAVPPRVADILQRTTGVTPTIVPAPDQSASSEAHSALISAPAGTSEADAWQAVGGLPAPNLRRVLGPDDAFSNPMTNWFEAGWVAASTVLLLGLLREIGDRGILAMQDARELLRVGLTSREVDKTYYVALLTPIAVAVPVGFCCAVLFALRGYSLGITLYNLSLIAAVAVAVGVLCVFMLLAVIQLQRRAFSRHDHA